MSKYANVFKSQSDERVVIDILCPGFSSEDVKVKVAKLNNGDIFKLVVTGTKSARKNKNGDDIPELASDHHISDFKYEFADIGSTDVDLERIAGDKLYKSSTFFTVDYELDNLKWSVTNGILRISIPKVEKARGVEIESCDNADEDSTGVVSED